MQCKRELPIPTSCCKCAVHALEDTEDIKQERWLHDYSDKPVYRFKAECIVRIRELERRLLDLKVLCRDAC
jgi:hypothetical protein